MKAVGVLFFLFPLVFSASIDLDPEDQLDEDAFEEYFHLPAVTDPVEHERREEALKENEALIKENNELYMEGFRSWWDQVNEFADLPADEFESQKTGLTNESFYGRGLLEPTPEERVDERSERYFDQFRYSRAAVPSSYSAVDLGLVSPVKSQKQCGSCVAFSNMAMVETCFKKITGVFGDYSEQQMVDCAYGDKNGAWGCGGAYPHAYNKWAGDNKVEFASEDDYPYTARLGTCPSEITPLNQGAKINGSYFTYSGNEELLKKVVYENGAALVAIHVNGGLQSYGGGIYSGCPAGVGINHGVVVVGYGTENGKDYWLFKNSWGTWWGDQGYGKLERGVNMCAIGPVIATTKCIKTEETSECSDIYDQCDDYAPYLCWHFLVKEQCQKSCGQC